MSGFESLSSEERTQFVQNVELATNLDQLDASVNSSFDVKSAAVDFRAIVSFVRDVDDQTKEDILHSTLFAALAADAKYNVHTATKQWYEQYKSTLQALGWSNQAFVCVVFTLPGARGYFGGVDGDPDSMVDVSNLGLYKCVDNLVLHLAKKDLEGDQLAIFELAVKRLQDDKNAAACRVFDQASISSNHAVFQTELAGMSGGNAVLKVGYYAYTTDQNITSVLFHTFGNESVKFSYGSQEMVLNHEFYSKIREHVADRIQKYKTRFVVNVTLT